MPAECFEERLSTPFVWEEEQKLILGPTVRGIRVLTALQAEPFEDFGAVDTF